MIKKLNLGFTALIIIAFIYSIYNKEQTIVNGDVVYLELEPVDPLSLMQGDYMRLGYAVNRQTSGATIPKGKTGFLILAVAENKIATFSGFDNGNALTANQIKFKYQKPDSRIVIQPDSFLFQQGLAELYDQAKFGIFRVTDSEHLLVGLADGDLKELKPPKTAAN